MTAPAIRSAGPGKHCDGRGLYVEVTPAGTKRWRWKYRFAGKEKRLSFAVMTTHAPIPAVLEREY
ncbi:MAG TPA: Arm DNA-binding domain-containing protein [Xanthomonadaceae bacterium]|nr:Arm DNA-binding domain-containing protein [Xanthomonadaceae bacterium]